MNKYINLKKLDKLIEFETKSSMLCRLDYIVQESFYECSNILINPYDNEMCKLFSDTVKNYILEKYSNCFMTYNDELYFDNQKLFNKNRKDKLQKIKTTNY